MTKPTQSSSSLIQSNLTTSADLSKRINSIRFLLIVLVVFIHSDSFLFERGYYTTDAPIIARFIIISIADIIGSLAVPLFFLISGYLLYSKETNFIPVLKKKSQTLLLPYILWTLLEISKLFIGQSIDLLKPYFNQNIIRDFGFTDWMYALIGKPFIREYHAPMLAHIGNVVWFLRDLFTLSLLFLIIKKAIDKFPICTLFIMFILWTSCANIYIVSTEALLFFSLGYYVIKYSLDYKKLDTIKTKDIAILYAITIIIENFWIEKVPIIHNINIIIGIISFIKLSKYLVSKPKLYSNLLKLNAYTFFVFAVHIMITIIANKIGLQTLSLTGYWLILQFFIAATLGVTVSLTVAIFMKKYFPKIYAVLTGGRI